MKFYSAIKKNEVLSIASKCMELENIILSEVSHAQRPKITCSPSYVDYRLTHTKGRACMQGMGQGKETKNLNVVDVLTVEE
jgi:hypothetical protein